MPSDNPEPRRDADERLHELRERARLAAELADVAQAVIAIAEGLAEEAAE